MNTLINFDFEMPIVYSPKPQEFRKKENKRFALTPKIFRKCELKIYFLTKELYELVKMFFARIQFTGGPDKHSMSQAGRIHSFDL